MHKRKHRKKQRYIHWQFLPADTHHIAHIHREEVILAEWFLTFDRLRVIVNCWCSDFWRGITIVRLKSVAMMSHQKKIVNWERGWGLALVLVCLQIQGELQKMSNEMFFMEFMNTWYKVSQWKKLWRTEAYRDSMSGPNDSISACCSPRLVHKLLHLVITLRKLGPGPKWSPFSRTGNFHSFENYLHGGENMSRHPKMWFDWQIVRHRKLSENAQPCQLLSEDTDITEQMQ